MLRFVTIVCGLALAVAAPNTNIFQIDLDPEEAAKYLKSPPFTDPQLSGRTAVLPLVKYNDPRFRTADAGPTLGHYWKNGHEIENTDDYVEEVYNAAQFHGQDGLGAYAYGYKAPESAKVENRERSGKVNGAYTYKAANNDLIKVNYWADSQGFHQEDNIPKYVPKQVEEAPEVKAARIAHEKAWKEAAYANLHPGAAQQAQQSVQQPQVYPGGYNQGFTQGYNQNQGYNQGYNNYDYQGAGSEQQLNYAAAPGANDQGRQGRYYNGYEDQSTTTTTTEEPTGPPRGFFYSYEYPVSILKHKSELSGDVKPGFPVDHDTVSVQGRY